VCDLLVNAAGERLIASETSSILVASAAVVCGCCAAYVDFHASQVQATLLVLLVSGFALGCFKRRPAWLPALIIAALLPGKSVTGVDVTDNALPDLRIPYLRFDGLRLPFADRSFDCAMLCNVLHHVEPGARADLLREALRVTGGGPLVVKDHLAGAPLDRLRLWVLDVLGNVPRGFMVDATYLDGRQWEALLTELHCVGAILPASQYRSGAWAWCFPNRLEICFRVTQSSFQT